MNMTARRVGALSAAWILCVNVAIVAAQSARISPPLPNTKSAAGPVAISMDRPPSAVVLQADSHVVALDTAKARIGEEVFRVPSGYDATDVAAAPYENGSIRCLTVNGKSSVNYGSFVLQVFPEGREVWTWLPQRGVYIGLAIDAASGFAYTTNSTSNALFRVRLGIEKAPVEEVRQVSEARRIGAVTIDARGRRLFVADVEAGRVYVVPMDKASNTTSIAIPGAQEIRAVAWNATTGMLFVADAAQEVVWFLDPDRPGAPPTLIKDKRFREPAGLTVTPDGSVWLVDEGARAAFELSTKDRAVVRAVDWGGRK